MKQLAELRAILETGVVRLVAVRARPNDLATLRELARFERSQAFNGAELIRRNRFFHLHLSRLAANAPLTAAIARLFDDCERLFYLGITALPTEEMEATHLRLVDALERHDIDTAEAICEKEAHDTTERVLRALLRYESSSTIPALALIGDEEPSSEDQHAHRMPSPGPGRARKTR
jgi:DNA-binding GntR family transcriptional regulator